MMGFCVLVTYNLYNCLTGFNILEGVLFLRHGVALGGLSRRHTVIFGELEGVWEWRL